MDALEQLLVAAEALEAAEGAFAAPLVRNAACQADDGSAKTIQILHKQVGELAGQKSNLMAKVR